MQKPKIDKEQEFFSQFYFVGLGHFLKPWNLDAVLLSLWCKQELILISLLWHKSDNYGTKQFKTGQPQRKGITARLS